MKPTRLILIPALGSEPAPYLVVAEGEVRERGLLALDSAERPEPMRTIAVAPGTDVTIRWLDLPVGGQAQQRAAALWMLRDSLAAPADRLAVVLGPVPAPGEPRLVVVAARSLLEAWVDYLDALGVRPDAIVPDVLTVQDPGADGGVNAVSFGASVALRGHRFAACVQSDLVDLVAGARRIVAIEDAAEVERSLIEAAVAPPINLLSDPIRPVRAVRGSWTRAFALAAVLAVSPLVLLVAAAARDDANARRDSDEARAVIARAAPDLAARPDPVEALRERVRSAPPPGGVVGATAALYAAIEAVEGADLDLLIVDPEVGMKASITHADYQDMEVVARTLEAQHLRLTETGTIDDRGRIVSDISIGSAR